MTSPVIARSKRHFSKRKWIVICLLSIWAGWYVWSRPPAPTWVSVAVAGGANPIGFTPDGLLVSLDSPDNVAAKSMFRIREAATGKVIQEHLLGIPLAHYGELTPDGTSVIVLLPMTGAREQMIVIDRMTGQRRYPPVGVNSVFWLPISDNGRYRVMGTRIAGDLTGKPASIVDLTTGQFLYPSDSKVAFSPDSLQWVSLDEQSGTPWLIFRDLGDGHEIGRTPAPAFPGAARIDLAGWTRDRLEIAARFDLSSRSDETRNWSFRVEGTQLTDQRLEPAHINHSERSPISGATTEYNWWLGGDDWAARASYESTGANWVADHWNGLVKSLPGGRRLYLKGSYRWQLVSLTTGEPIAREIQVIDDLFNIPFVASRDGHWLVEAGKKLRVWRLPPPPQHEQLPWALFAATAPWMLLLIRRQDNPPPDERPV